MNEEQKQAEINAYRNLLEQNDYIGRKVAFEVAALFKAQFPNIPMPIYDKYFSMETKAEEFRQAIDEILG